MKASEYCMQLALMIEEHGDYELLDAFNDEIPMPEFNTDGEPAFVLDAQ